MLKRRPKWLARLVRTFAAVGALFGVGLVTGVLPADYHRLPHMRADAAAAWAGWATFGIAVVAAFVAYNQVKVARETREEQAQPNVVVYSEPNPHVPQILEIVIRNFGTTPAYNINITVTPPLKATPNIQTMNKIADVPIPIFPILAPGQEWRTVWDSAVERHNYVQKLQQEYDKNLWAPCEFKERALFPRHEALATYEDSKQRVFKTEGVLDFDTRVGTTFVDIETIHDLTKTIDKYLDKQNDILSGIQKRLAEFGTEHEGVWVYGSGDDGEREYRRLAAEAQAARIRKIRERTGLARLLDRPPRRSNEVPSPTQENSSEPNGSDDCRHS